MARLPTVGVMIAFHADWESVSPRPNPQIDRVTFPQLLNLGSDGKVDISKLRHITPLLVEHVLLLHFYRHDPALLLKI
jgi:hypothetical protein